MKQNILSPLDGRYQTQLQALTQVCGPEAFAAARVRAEAAWLLILSLLKLPDFKPFSPDEIALLRRLPQLKEQDLQLLSDLENKGSKNRPATRHDVKAVEYFVADKLGSAHKPWVHFALTSEDINSAAYGQILSAALAEVLIPALEKLNKEIASRARKYARSVLLARTHGQPAVPTTFGREMKVFERRLARQLAQLKKQQISCKFGGAIGAYNAHCVAFPAVNWPRAARAWVGLLNKGLKVKLSLTPVSTQVDPRDSYAEIFDILRRVNVILLGLSQDMWHYTAAGIVRLQTVVGEVGSSTMPHKVNPIDFENAEGNLVLANTLLNVLSQKLPISRLQRDLSDSTVLRNIPVAFGHCLLAYQNILTGLAKMHFNAEVATAELQAHPQVLAEAYQVLLRAHGVQQSYEKLKAFTRGKDVTLEDLHQFIQSLPLENAIKAELLAVKVEKYVGLSAEQARGEYD